MSPRLETFVEFGKGLKTALKGGDHRAGITEVVVFIGNQCHFSSL